VERVTSCTFGGAQLDQLFITTANIETDLTKQPLAGSLFVLKNPGVRGLPEQYFGEGQN
jgi:sugar lactone lactonase YvrE